MMNNIIFEEKACPLGCEAGDSIVLTGQSNNHPDRNIFTIVKCLKCGLKRVNPRPTPETIGFYYPESYQPYQSSKVGTVPNRGFVKKIIGYLVGETFATKLPAIKKGRMLEVGCASGAFMHAMSLDGWDVSGIEYSESAGMRARELGFDVHIGQLETAPEPDKKFDMIVGWHIFEHLHEPVDVLKRLSKWLKPDGYLVLSMPNINGLEPMLFGTSWYDIEIPIHLFHYSPQTVKKVLDASGFDTEKIFYQRNITTIFGSLGYYLKEHYGNDTRIAKFLLEIPASRYRYGYLLSPVSRMLALMKLSGRMTLWAKPLFVDKAIREKKW